MTDPTRISDEQHNNAPAVPQGLERYEPTVMVEESRGRLTATGAVMKPKEDGRWVRLRDLTATPAPVPAQEVTTPYHRDIWGISHAMADLYYDDWVLLVRAYQKLDASIARMKEQATAQAVPQGWTKAIDSVPLESDGEVFIRFTDGSIGTGWATYWHGSSNDFAHWTFPDPDEFRMVSEWAKNVPASTGMHWTENEPVRLPQARTGRVYLAGPMTGLPELNFPAFNQEADRLRAEGLQVLNPADHGIVDGADWADYLRHDIAGLASCERIHLLRGWTKSKGACLEMTIAKALGMTVTYQVDAEMEHNNAPAVPQGWKLVPVEPTRAMWAAVNKLDDEMAAGSYDGKGCSIEQAWNCMLDFAPDAPALEATPAPAPAQYKDSTPQLSVGESSFESWFESYNPANKGDKQRSRDAYAAGMGDPLVAAAPAQGEPFGYFRVEPFGWTDCAKDDEGAIALYERPQEVGLTDEGRQQVFIAAERRMVREPNLSWRDAIVDEVIAALRAKGGKRV